MSFYVGQRVVCISGDGQWYGTETLEMSIGPANGEINTIDALDRHGCLIFNKYDPIDGYMPQFFAPIEEYSDSKSIAKSLVKELSKTDKAKEPIKELI